MRKQKSISPQKDVGVFLTLFLFGGFLSNVGFVCFHLKKQLLVNRGVAFSRVLGRL